MISNIPFWGWLGLSVICGIIFLFTVSGDDSKKGIGVIGFGALAAFSGIVFLFIGVIRFAKWVWT
jgi:hypothetical protein